MKTSIHGHQNHLYFGKISKYRVLTNDSSDVTIFIDLNTEEILIKSTSIDSKVLKSSLSTHTSAQCAVH